MEPDVGQRSRWEWSFGSWELVSEAVWELAGFEYRCGGLPV